ncbi:hypothetical protein F53441_12701 [Fusarium austroafricanum]|uniref:Xylanolytic transcriptional activator regulatory domain-containing protein n=1 Tax=Fusarium austroafricanum TaxID=2364996 RepID=A0A8H4JTT1_9HYPO|nr:hypothetical protein F53441_12701 [Fusarium austroafricanum]
MAWIVHSTAQEATLSERLKRIEDALSQTLSQQKDPVTSVAKSSTPNSLATDPHRSSDSCVGEPGHELSQRSSRPSSTFLNAYSTTGSPRLSHETPFQYNVPSPSGGFTSAVSYGQIHFGGCHFGHISQHNGMPTLSEEGRQWITSKTGQDVLFNPSTEDFSKFLPSSASHYYHNSRDLYDLPERSVTERIFESFIQSTFSLVFPVVDRVLFKDTIELAYQPHTDESPSLEQLSAKVGVMAFVSITALFQESKEMPYVDTELYAMKARYLLTNVFDIASITNLQTVFKVTLHEIFSGRLRSGAVFHAIACRMVFSLGGHMYISCKPGNSQITRPERERRHLRLLFWLCYIFDKDIALRTGQPPLMSDDYCDLTLPDNYLDCYTYLPNLDDNLSHLSVDDARLMPHLPGDPCLSHIKDKTSRILYSAQAAKKTPAQLLRDIRELDEELEAWRQTIPPNFRPVLSITDESQVALEGMILPRTSGRCMGPDFENTHDLPEWLPGVESSMALALEASRSTLVYLRAAMCGLASEAFWVIVYYPTSAMMTLFFNILTDPLHERAEQDLELLKAAADLVNSLPVRRLTALEVSHMKMVNDFVVELVRLGRSAICKASMEKDEKLEKQMMSIR